MRDEKYGGARRKMRLLRLARDLWAKPYFRGLINRIVWGKTEPRDGWASFDRTPWAHPWLTAENIAAMREHGRTLRHSIEGLRHKAEHYRYAFTGNIGNGMYTRAVGLRRQGLAVDVVLNPQDNFVMSHPFWEEYEGEVADGVGLDVSAFPGFQSRMKSLDHVYSCDQDSSYPDHFTEALHYASVFDVVRWKEFFCHMPTYEFLQSYDAILAAQYPYFAYFARRPYLATQVGGDIWYECSRDDAYGRLQRVSFAAARAFLASNPWSFAFARRYGFRHLTYLPFIVDDQIYRPGDPVYREEWRQRIGGSFFVLSTARLDDYYKGSSVALDGFAQFAASHPEARLILIGWGEDLNRLRDRLARLGIAERTLILPVAGKRRLIDYLRSADCLLGQFVLGYYGAAGIEAMACGLPIVMKLNRAQYNAFCETGAPPVYRVVGREAGPPTALEKAYRIGRSGAGSSTQKPVTGRLRRAPKTCGQVMDKVRGIDFDDPAPVDGEENEETLAAIEEGIRDAGAGHTVPIEEVRRLLPGWIAASSSQKKSWGDPSGDRGNLLGRFPRMGSVISRRSRVRKLVHTPILVYYQVHEARAAS